MVLGLLSLHAVRYSREPQHRVAGLCGSGSAGCSNPGPCRGWARIFGQGLVFKKFFQYFKIIFQSFQLIFQFFKLAVLFLPRLFYSSPILAELTPGEFYQPYQVKILVFALTICHIWHQFDLKGIWIGLYHTYFGPQRKFSNLSSHSQGLIFYPLDWLARPLDPSKMGGKTAGGVGVSQCIFIVF